MGLSYGISGRYEGYGRGLGRPGGWERRVGEGVR